MLNAQEIEAQVIAAYPRVPFKVEVVAEEDTEILVLTNPQLPPLVFGFTARTLLAMIRDGQDIDELAADAAKTIIKNAWPFILKRTMAPWSPN